MLPRILILALICLLVSCKGLVEKYKRSNSGISSRDKKVLYDFRTPVQPKFIDHASAPEAIRSLNSCNPPIQRVDGSFTYAAEQESLYVLHCGGSTRVFVFSGGKLQASSDTAYSAVVGTFDLNRDDKNELLLVGETKHTGEVSREASLRNFEKNSLRPVEDFGIVYHDSCALFTGADDAKRKSLIATGLTPYVEAVVISYLPHQGREMPSFTADRFRAPCPAAGAAPSNWQTVSPRTSDK